MHTFLRWLRFRADDSCTCEDWTEHCENLTILKYRLDMHINEMHTVREGVHEWGLRKGQLYDDSFAPPPAFFYFIFLHSAALCTVIC